MKRVGEVVRTAQGTVVARPPGAEYPPLGSEVLDENLETVGEVVDVFGPVDHPYVAVAPEADVAVTRLLGAPLYAR
ncbi:MAG: H/ACA ribonucleoprotein complex subunit GAR1 [Haloarculaceae archaeon]